MWRERITTAGGSMGGLCAYFLQIDLLHITEIALFALIGASVGELVKESVKLCKRQIIRRLAKKNINVKK
ncbi:MAG: hypothetical protein H7320_13070 [Ferruginibacter sp.]|nr:hypothetical protein [Ferruginibacter sp.]